jgi:hypothetical protein
MRDLDLSVAVGPDKIETILESWGSRIDDSQHARSSQCPILNVINAQ